MLSLHQPTPVGNDVEQEARDLTAATLRQIADRIREKGWMNTSRESAAFTLEEISQAIEWGL